MKHSCAPTIFFISILLREFVKEKIAERSQEDYSWNQNALT